MALAAALLLVLQTVVGAFAMGAGAVPVARDIYGNPLCITSGEHGRQGDPSVLAHETLPGCCTLACGMAVVGVGPAPDRLVLAAPLAMAVPAIREPQPLAPVRSLERPSAEPRAPPLS